MPKVVDHDSRRKALAEAAARVIARVGVENATVRAIASEAGFSTGVLAHYFSDKDAILLQALNWTNEHVMDRFKELFRDPDSMGFEEIKELVHLSMPLGELSRLEWSLRLHFWAYSITREDMTDAHRNRIKGWRAMVSDRLDHMKHTGQVRQDIEVKVAAASLVALVWGICVQLLFSPEEDQEEAVALIDNFIDDLRVPPANSE